MARSPETNAGLLLGAAIVVVYALVTTVPLWLWIMGGIGGGAFYLYHKSKVLAPKPPEKSQRRSPSLKTEWHSPKPVRREPPAPTSRGSSRDAQPFGLQPPPTLTAPPTRTPKAPAPAMAEPRAAFRDDAPVRVFTGQSVASPSFRVPDAPKGYGPGKWLPAGESSVIAGVTIPDGLVYVGNSLPTPYGGNDPCLIDPSLPVAAFGSYTERQFGYWPSYSGISSSARRAYLEWLADGRRDPAADIGYVFLFFYGLERRAILDAAQYETARAEWPVIAAELRRLLGIYGESSGSFRSYASSLLDWVTLAEHPEKTYLKPVPSFPRTYELPLYVRVALGQSAVDEAPVPAQLALAWARLDPSISLRTPALRCGTEFDQLFTQEYHASHGDGIVLPRNRTKLKLVHRPASAGFHGHSELQLTFGDIPDVTALTAPVKKLQQVVDAVTAKLDQFSRYIGKNPDAKHALEGILLLPVMLWPEASQQALGSLRSRMTEGVLSVPFRDVLANLGAVEDFNKGKAQALARALESQNVGMEPDVLSGAKVPKPDDTVVLFAVEPSETVSQSTPAYQAAMLTVQLATAVAAADGEFGPKELGYIKAQVTAWSHLTPNHIRRLMAHTELLVAEPVSLSTLRKKLEVLGADAKASIARFMATVAQADGTVSPTEVRMLERVYKALGVEPDRVFTDVHAAAMGSQPTASAEARRREGFKLDPARIAALQKDTAAVSALLAGIFQEDEAPPPVSDAPEEEVEATSSGLLDLDEPHSAFARLLLSRPEWAKEELDDAATDLDLMLAGAIETLNDAAFAKYDMPFADGEDPVTVNPELVEKLAE